MFARDKAKKCTGLRTFCAFSTSAQPRQNALVGFIAQLTDMKLSQSDVATFCNAGLTKVVSYQEDYTAQCIGLSHTLGHIACVSLHVCWYLPTFFSRVPS